MRPTTNAVPTSLVPTSRVAMLGFRAHASIFAGLLAPRGCAMGAWDPALAGPDAARMRARIESAGVDVSASLPAALRGARLVLLDGVDLSVAVATLLQPGQHVMDLAASTAPDVDAVLVALGLPEGAHWQRACAAVHHDMAHSAANDMPAVHRGELP